MKNKSESKTVAHRWDSQAPFCDCGQDTVTCQGCGKLVCGNVSVRHDNSNIGPCCFSKFGLGHQGTTPEAAAFNAKNHKWALDSRNRWSDLAVLLEAKLDLATKALDEIASMKASKHRYDGLKGASDMQEIAMAALVAIDEKEAK